MYAINDPGAVPGFESEGMQINEHGDVVGILKPVVGTETKAFVWKTTLIQLSDLGFAGEALAINGTGQIAGAVETAKGRLAAAVWNAAGVLTQLAEPAGAAFSFTHGIDAAGRIVGGYVHAGREIPLLWATPGATPAAAPMPAAAIWSEALTIGGGLACGTSFDGQQRAFVWNIAAGAVNFLAGETAVAVAINDVLGTAQGKPAVWAGGAGAPAILPGINGIATGVASAASGPREIVGTVSIPGNPSTCTPFLRRDFRRDELDPSSTELKPKLLELPAPETIDLNMLLPPNSGWRLLTANGVNMHGQITGSGTIGGETRAYRLSPPGFESPLVRFFGLAEILILFGGVAVGGGGFGITPSGQIIPIPPPRPEALTVERVVELARETLEELAKRAEQAGQKAAFNNALKRVIEEASAIAKR
jgi:hypothetical protein